MNSFIFILLKASLGNKQWCKISSSRCTINFLFRVQNTDKKKIVLETCQQRLHHPTLLVDVQLGKNKIDYSII